MTIPSAAAPRSCSPAPNPGASTFIEVAADRVREARLNGEEVDTSGWSAEKGLTLTGLAAENTLVVDADFLYSSSGQGLHRSLDPVDKEVYLYSQFETADAQRVFACFDQPDLKAVFTWHATVPAHWKVVSNCRDRARGAGRRRREQGGALRAIGEDEHVHHRALRRAVPRGPREPRRHRPGHLRPRIHEAVPGRRRHLPHHEAGLRLLQRAVRHPLPAAQVRPAVGAGLQRRRDGELRLRRPRRVVLHLPVTGDRLRV